MSSSLARIDVRLPAELKDQLTAIAKQRGVSLSEMAVSALLMMLEERVPQAIPDGGSMRSLARVERLLEAFIKTYLTITPEVPEAQKRDAAQRGKLRWQQLMQVIEKQKEEV